MASPIQQITVAVSSFIILVMAFVIFDPLINGVLNMMVIDYLNTGVGTALDQNAAQLDTARLLIQTFFGIFSYFIIFAIMVRLFTYIGFYTEEQGQY
jgi:hypothetical protein